MIRVRLMAWFKRFVDPIILPDGRELLTLRDAAEYITALPKAEHDAADWQVAMEVLLLVAERDGPEMLARIAVMKALNRHNATVMQSREGSRPAFSDCSVMRRTISQHTAQGGKPSHRNPDKHAASFHPQPPAGG